MTLFGETPDGQAQGFFTGKPHVDEFGYAFLFRNYRPDKAKWQTADPLGYPDGWNALAYVNNGVSSSIDLYGAVEMELRFRELNGMASFLPGFHSTMHIIVTQDELERMNISESVKKNFKEADSEGYRRLYVSGYDNGYLELRFSYDDDSPELTLHQAWVVSDSLDTLKLAEKYISLAEKYQQNEKKTDYDLLNGNNGIFDDPNEGNCNSLQRTLMELSGARTLVPEHMKSLEKILSGFSHIMGAQYFE